MAGPQYTQTTLSSLCSLGWRPLLLTGFLLEWLRQHFSDTNSIEDENLENTLWKADNTTNILIESITRWKPELTEKRPAIIAKRNDLVNNRLIIDDREMGFRPDSTNYVTYFVGSHTLFCIAREGAEAEKLSTEVYRELVEFGPVVRQLMRLHKFQVQSIGAIFRLEEARETFAVPVNVSYAFEEAWKITPRAPILKRIDLAVFQP